MIYDGGEDLDSRRRQSGRQRVTAMPAQCDSSSRYNDRHGEFCYSACGAGFEPKGPFRCISRCEGKLPAETAGMCGRDSGIVAKAVTEMATVREFKVSEDIIRMIEQGIDVNSLSSTVQVFIDQGKPFDSPNCPVLNVMISVPSSPSKIVT